MRGPPLVDPGGSDITQPNGTPDGIQPEPGAPIEGWAIHVTQPDRHGGSKARWSKKRVALVVLLALFVGAPLAATALLDSTGHSGSASIATIGFGTGGSQCTLANVASRFATGVPIRVVAQFTPALPAGDSVAITVSENGTERVDLDGTVKLDVPQTCVSGTWPALTPGHYRVVVSPSTTLGMPPISGEFDVTQ